MALQNSGGTNSAPNRAPAAKVIAGALANERVAQSLISALGAYSVPALIVAAHVSQTTDFGALLAGDKVLHIDTTGAGMNSLISVSANGNLGTAAIVGDIYVAFRAVNLDSNNPIPYSTLNGNMTGNGGQEF